MPYRIQSKWELLVGVDEFLDEVTILPPGSWNPQIRIEPVDVPSYYLKSQEQRHECKTKMGKMDELKDSLLLQEAELSHANDPMLQRSGRCNSHFLFI
jgi:hypothetical protein